MTMEAPAYFKNFPRPLRDRLTKTMSSEDSIRVIVQNDLRVSLVEAIGGYSYASWDDVLDGYVRGLEEIEREVAIKPPPQWWESHLRGFLVLAAIGDTKAGYMPLSLLGEELEVDRENLHSYLTYLESEGFVQLTGGDPELTDEFDTAEASITRSGSDALRNARQIIQKRHLAISEINSDSRS